MQYAHTLTDQKLGGSSADNSQTRYVLGRIQYAPTLTGKKMGDLLADDSSARYARVPI